MSRKQGQRVSTGGGQNLDNNPFAALGTSAYPEGAAETPAPAPREAAPSGGPKGGRRLDVRREKSGRGGKTVTTLRGFAADTGAASLGSLAHSLKTACACGGTVKDGVIELQGDVADKLLPELRKRGYAPVRSGG